MSAPLPPDEWETRIPAKHIEPRHAFPPRPEVSDATESEPEPPQVPAEHEGYRPNDVSLRPAPHLLRPEQQRPPGWRRPPGQQDDKGEPTGR
jgi:hypothetical protein